jgi:hypothetical protein
MDVDAFTAFYAKTARPLWLYLYRVTRNAADADDILQEAFCRLLGAERELTTEEQCRKYVFRIASNLVVDRWRLQQREMVSKLDGRGWPRHRSRWMRARMRWGCWRPCYRASGPFSGWLTWRATVMTRSLKLWVWRVEAFAFSCSGPANDCAIF